MRRMQCICAYAPTSGCLSYSPLTGVYKTGRKFLHGESRPKRRFSDGRDASPNPSLVRSVAPAKSLALPVKIAELELALASLLLQRLQLPKDRRGVLRHRQRN